MNNNQVQIPALLRNNEVTLGKLLNLPKFNFSFLSGNGII